MITCVSWGAHTRGHARVLVQFFARRCCQHDALGGRFCTRVKEGDQVQPCFGVLRFQFISSGGGTFTFGRCWGFFASGSLICSFLVLRHMLIKIDPTAE